MKRFKEIMFSYLFGRRAEKAGQPRILDQEQQEGDNIRKFKYVLRKVLPMVVGSVMLLAIMMGTPMVHAKRAAPARIAPVIHKGIKYVSNYEKTPVKFTILVSAERSSDGVILWKSELYSISYNLSLERDVQEVYLSSMTLKADRIEAIDEKGDRYIVDIRDGSLKK